MTKAERIAEIRSKPYNQCTYDELLWALDELEKAQAVVERLGSHIKTLDPEKVNFLPLIRCIYPEGAPNYAQMVTDDAEAREDKE